MKIIARVLSIMSRGRIMGARAPEYKEPEHNSLKPLKEKFRSLFDSKKK
jgi:hypothetical protein